MKKVVPILAIMMIAMGVLSLAGTINYATGIEHTIGTGFPNYGWSMKNANGQVTGFQGINPFLGYSAKYFFSPMKLNSWNAFWGWGTVLLVVPAYVEFGSDYVGKDGIYFGVRLTNFLVPSIEIGVMY